MPATPFLPVQYPLLHLLGILSVVQVSDAPAPPTAPGRILPQGVYFNALCFLTEQIHQVAKPYETFNELLKDVERLDWNLGTRKSASPGPPEGSIPTTVSTQAARTGRKSGSKATPAKRTSLSPVVSRSLRKTPSRQQLGNSPTRVDPGGPAAGDAGRRAAEGLAKWLKENVEMQVESFALERSEALLSTLDDFKELHGIFEDPNSHSFLDRSSPLALWLRRCLLNLRSMAYEDMEKLVDEIIAFCNPADGSAPNHSTRKQLDATAAARADAFDVYSAAMLKNDYSTALEAAGRFFDVQSAPFAGGLSNNRGMRQHALLNLASFHMHHREYAAAQQACSEGIKVARQASDLVALSALISLLRIIETESKQKTGAEGEGEELAGLSERKTEDPGGYTAPMDYVRDVQFGQESRVVLPALSCDLYRAKALHYSSMTTKSNMSSKEKRKEKKLLMAQGRDISATGPDAQPRNAKWNRLDAPSWYASAAKLWQDIAVPSVSSAYGKTGLFLVRGTLRDRSRIRNDANPAGSSRAELACFRAEELSQAGAYEAARLVLLSELRCLSHTHTNRPPEDVSLLQTSLAGCIDVECGRRGFNSVLKTSQPSKHALPHGSSYQARGFGEDATPTERRSSLNANGLVIQTDITSGIQRARKLLASGQPAHALPLTIRAIAASSLTDGQVFLREHVEAHILVAKVQMALRAPDRALRSLTSVWVSLLPMDHPQLLAEAQVVRAGCLVACLERAQAEGMPVTESDQLEALQEAVGMLEASIGIASSIKDVQGVSEASAALAKLCQRLGETARRDEAAALWLESTKQAGRDEEQRRLVDEADLIARFSAIASGKNARG